MHDLGITTRRPTYFVLLLENELSRRLIQALHCALMHESISFVSVFSIAVPLPSCAVCQLIRLLHLVFLASRLFP